ncbi:MAG: hypothetical protein P8Y99_17035 [Calditrichaceae bacterium]
MKQIKIEYTFLKFLSFILITIMMTACAHEKPSPAVIEKAKISTLSILDSLKQDKNTIVENIDLTSEFFDDNILKYVINYEIETGLDSAHIAKRKASVYLEKKSDYWYYNFIFDQTYEDTIKLE